eukprot:7623296-Karenia_brevis.AAC.1
MLKKCHVDDWVSAQREKKWHWAGHLARRTDSRWSSLLLKFQPRCGHRNRGHPVKRWCDDIIHFFVTRGYAKDAWMDVAQDRDRWIALESDYVQQQ